MSTERLNLLLKTYGSCKAVAGRAMQYSGIVLKKQEPFAFHFPCKTDVGQAVRYSGIILKRREPFAFRFPKIKPETGLNIFAQLRPSEPQHSRILRDLLDPRGKHGCGDTFLRLFFEKVLGKTEFSIADGDRWTVSAEAERFDVRIQNQNSTKIIIIENKSNGADDQPNQLYRYWYFGIHQRQYRFQKVDKETYAKILYASPDYGKEPSPQTKMRPAKWDSELPPSVPEGTVKVVRFRREIADWLEACREQISAQSDISQPDMSFYLKQYVDYWRL